MIIASKTITFVASCSERGHGRCQAAGFAERHRALALRLSVLSLAPLVVRRVVGLEATQLLALLSLCYWRSVSRSWDYVVLQVCCKDLSAVRFLHET